MQHILDELVNLSPDELTVVIERAKALKGSGIPSGQARARVATAAGTDRYDYVLAIICELHSKHGLSVVDVAIAKSVRTYPTFKRDIPEVVKFVRRFAPNRTVESAVFRMMYRHVVQEYQWGIVRILGYTASLPRVLDELLPGYYQRGLLGMAMQQLARRD